VAITRRDALILAAGAASTVGLQTTDARVSQSQASDVSVIPPGVVTLEDFETLAQQRLSAQTFTIVHSGVADDTTVRWNREAFQRIRLRPRVLADVSQLDTRLILLGQTLAHPILLAPAGVHGLLHPRAEVETARGAARSRTVLVIPSMPAAPVEEIVRAADPPPWYQLYVTSDRGSTRDEAQRAEHAGCRVLFVTVDGVVPGVRNALMRPPFPPVATPGGLHTLADATLSWKDIAWLRSIVRIPVVLKGIIDPADAERAVGEGVSGIVVSNHGGRTLDTVPATIDVLPAVAEKVAGRIPILMDGGIRRGTDVLKALALGASAVLIGRPFLYGLGSAGADGVHRVLTILREEFEMAMALSGRPSLHSIDRSVLR
jgi:4-hydroxymandelate oxidase